jgi:hypothetical protein
MHITRHRQPLPYGREASFSLTRIFADIALPREPRSGAKGWGTVSTVSPSPERRNVFGRSSSRFATETRLDGSRAVKRHKVPEAYTSEWTPVSIWNALEGRYSMKPINHQLSYRDAGACTNQAESFFSRLRRAEQGHHHHIAGVYLARYAQESAWREDHRRQDNGGQVRGVVGLAVGPRPSVDFCEYWQRSVV